MWAPAGGYFETYGFNTLKYSDDSGETWNVDDTFPYGGDSIPALCIDSNDNLHVVFFTRNPITFNPFTDTYNIEYAGKIDDIWSASVTLASSVNLSFTSNVVFADPIKLLIDSNDNLHIFYSDCSDVYYQTYNGLVWSGEVNWTNYHKSPLNAPDYDQFTPYGVGDIVAHGVDSFTYRCVLAHTGVSPFTPEGKANWVYQRWDGNTGWDAAIDTNNNAILVSSYQGDGIGYASEVRETCELAVYRNGIKTDVIESKIGGYGRYTGSAGYGVIGGAIKPRILCTDDGKFHITYQKTKAIDYDATITDPDEAPIGQYNVDDYVYTYANFSYEIYKCLASYFVNVTHTPATSPSVWEHVETTSRFVLGYYINSDDLFAPVEINMNGFQDLLIFNNNIYSIYVIFTGTDSLPIGSLKYQYRSGGVWSDEQTLPITVPVNQGPYVIYTSLKSLYPIIDGNRVNYDTGFMLNYETGSGFLDYKLFYQYYILSSVDGTTLGSYVDCGEVGLVFSQVDINLDHLEGETVGVLANGIYLGTQTVSSGAVSLPGEYSKAQVGLLYQSDFQTLNIKLDPMENKTQGNKIKVGNVTFRLIDSQGGFIGPNEDTLYEAFTQEAFELSFGINLAATDMFTGDVRVPLGSGYSNGGNIFYRQNDPLPITISAVIPEVNVGGATR